MPSDCAATVASRRGHLSMRVSRGIAGLGVHRNFSSSEGGCREGLGAIRLSSRCACTTGKVIVKRNRAVIREGDVFTRDGSMVAGSADEQGMEKGDAR